MGDDETKPRAAGHQPLREGELDRVLDEAVATGTDHEGGVRLDAVLHHHVRRDAARMQGNLKQTDKSNKTSQEELKTHSISIKAS